MNNKDTSGIRKLWQSLLTTGPGIFCVGYTLGTGSVTSMAQAGADFGMQLLWVLFLSCLFSWILMEAYGRYAVVTGHTAIHSFKTQLKFGKPLAIIIAIFIVLGQWCCLSGIVGTCSNALYEMLRLMRPDLPASNYWAVLGIAVAMMLVMYWLVLVGKYSFFEKVLVVFVSIMAFCFILSMFIAFPSPKELLEGLTPKIPKIEGATLLIAAFVGTTMAAPTFVVRPLLLKGKGWTIKEAGKQRMDAGVAAVVTFIISVSIMVCATGALYSQSQSLNKVLDMVNILTPLAGRFAVVIFLIGILSAGLSSVFPITMVAPFMISDYRSGKLDTNSKTFRIITGMACVFGLMVPIIGANPIAAQVLTQVSQVFSLPLVVACIACLVNNKRLMGEYKAGVWLNAGLTAAFIFSCGVSYAAINVLRGYF